MWRVWGVGKIPGVGTAGCSADPSELLVLMQMWREKLGCENLEGAGVVEKS